MLTSFEWRFKFSARPKAARPVVKPVTKVSKSPCQCVAEKPGWRFFSSEIVFLFFFYVYYRFSPFSILPLPPPTTRTRARPGTPVMPRPSFFHGSPGGLCRARPTCRDTHACSSLSVGAEEKSIYSVTAVFGKALGFALTVINLHPSKPELPGAAHTHMTRRDEGRRRVRHGYARAAIHADIAYRTGGRTDERPGRVGRTGTTIKLKYYASRGRWRRGRFGSPEA